MPLSLRRWSARGLFLSWGVYWLVLLAVKLGPAAVAIWSATRAPSGDQNNVNVRFTGALFSLSVSVLNRVTWSGTISLMALVAWVAVPPLVLWALWMASRPRVGAEAVGGDAVGAGR